MDKAHSENFIKEGAQSFEPPYEKDFVEQLRWHLYENGTRPGGAPGTSGTPWTDDEFITELDKLRGKRIKARGQSGITGDARQNLRNWMNRDNACSPRSYNLIEKVLFGDNPRYESWRRAYRAAARQQWDNAFRRPADEVAAARNLADRNLIPDQSDDLLIFYHQEHPVEITLGSQTIRLPLICALAPEGEGIPEEQNISILISHLEFHIPDRLSAFYRKIEEQALKLGHFNGDIIRLEDIYKEATGRTVIVFRRAKYFEALATNYNMDSEAGTPAMRLRTLVHGSGKLWPSLANDPLVNSIGVVVMIESSDGHLVVQERSGEVVNRANTRSSSTSGEMKWRQLGVDETAREIPFSRISAVAVEHVREELAIKLSSIRFLGLFRELLRGGKPEFYFYGKASVSLSEIQRRLPQAEHRRESRSISSLEFRNARAGKIVLSARQAFELRISAALDAILEKANMTLIAGLLLTADHVRRFELAPSNQKGLE